MADGSKIEWTDATWNPITGCSVVSPGCTNCYAMRLAGGRMRNHPSRKGLTKPSKGGPVWTGELRLNEQWLDQPSRWRRPRKIFVCAHGDLFHEDVPDEWIDRVFAVMALAPQHRFQVLTKRSRRMFDTMWRLHRAFTATQANRAFGSDDFRPTLLDDWPYMANAAASRSFNLEAVDSWPLPNVWLGVSAENQERLNDRVPELLDTPAAVRFVSAEPLLGPLDFERGGWALHRPFTSPRGHRYPGLDWIIVGGESGRGARPFRIDWARSIIEQCREAGVACFIKQVGSRPMFHRDDTKAFIRHPKGEDPAEWPPDIRVREMPR